MKKNCFFFLLFACASSISFGQPGGGRTTTLPAVAGANNGLISSNNRYGSKAAKGEISYEEALVEYANIQGSAFLHGGEIIVDLIFYNDSLIEDIPILYDQYNQEIIAKDENGKEFILNQIYYKGFSYEQKGTTEIYRRVHPTRLKYFEVLHNNGDFVFCKDTRITITEDSRHIPGMDIKNKKFVRKSTYFIIKGDEVNEVKLKDKSILEHLPKKYRSKIPVLQKKLKIKKLKKEQDYIQLMDQFEKAERA